MLSHMEYVYAVYVNKSFSKAAEQLYISQPALSATVKKVEEKIGLPIFDRSRNPIQLTPAGEYYIESIRNIMNLKKEMRLYFDSMLENNHNVTNFGGAAFFCAYILPKLTQDFNEEYPNFRVNLLEANANDLIKNLRSKVVDIIIDTEKQPHPKGLESIVWFKEHILLAVPKAYNINDKLKKYRLTFKEVANRKHLTEDFPEICLSHFKHERFLLLKKGNDLYDRGLAMTKKAGFTPNISMYLDQMLTSYYIAKNGKGIAFIRDGITRYLETTNELFFYKIKDPNAYRNIMIYYKKSFLLSDIGKKFIEFLKRNKPVNI